MATVTAPPEPLIGKLTPFQNEPFVDYTKEENARAMRAAIAKVRSELGRDYDLVIGGKRVQTTAKIKSLNPAKPSELVGQFSKADKTHGEAAMEAAQAAFKTWSRTSFEQRAELLLRVAKTIRERKHEFSAWMVLEVGKNWAE